MIRRLYRQPTGNWRDESVLSPLGRKRSGGGKHAGDECITRPKKPLVLIFYCQHAGLPMIMLTCYMEKFRRHHAAGISPNCLNITYCGELMPTTFNPSSGAFLRAGDLPAAGVGHFNALSENQPVRTWLNRALRA